MVAGTFRTPVSESANRVRRAAVMVGRRLENRGDLMAQASVEVLMTERQRSSVLLVDDDELRSGKPVEALAAALPGQDARSEQAS